MFLNDRDKNIIWKIGNDKSVDIGTRFGSIVGNDCTIGISVMLLPGTYIPSNALIQALVKNYRVSRK